jgi:TPR repeat protein
VRYYHGSGVKKDHAKAARLYRRAVDRGYAWAMYLLGLCYRDGEGVARNLHRARYWFTKAASAKGKGERRTVTEARSALAEMRTRRTAVKSL